MKFFLVVALVLVVVWLVRSSSRRRHAPPPAPPASSPSAPPAATDAATPQREAMVACAHCGLMLPAGEALPALSGPTGRQFCSEAHRAAGEAPPAH